jgi:hypothetical protein
MSARKCTSRDDGSSLRDTCSLCSVRADAWPTVELSVNAMPRRKAGNVKLCYIRLNASSRPMALESTQLTYISTRSLPGG